MALPLSLSLSVPPFRYSFWTDRTRPSATHEKKPKKHDQDGQTDGSDPSPNSTHHQCPSQAPITFIAVHLQEEMGRVLSSVTMVQTSSSAHFYFHSQPRAILNVQELHFFSKARSRAVYFFEGYVHFLYSFLLSPLLYIASLHRDTYPSYILYITNPYTPPQFHFSIVHVHTFVKYINKKKEAKTEQLIVALCQFRQIAKKKKNLLGSGGNEFKCKGPAHLYCNCAGNHFFSFFLVLFVDVSFFSAVVETVDAKLHEIHNCHLLCKFI